MSLKIRKCKLSNLISSIIINNKDWIKNVRKSNVRVHVWTRGGICYTENMLSLTVGGFLSIRFKAKNVSVSYTLSGGWEKPSGVLLQLAGNSTNISKWSADTFPIAINANWAEILWCSYILNPWPVKIELSSIQVFISFSYNKQFCKDVFFVSPWLRLSTEMHTVCSRLSVSRCRAW